MGWRVGRGLSTGGAEGCCLWLAEEEEPFRLGGKVHRRTSWAEQALRGPAPKGPKGLGREDLRPLAIPFKEVSEILENVKVKCADLRPASGLDCLVGIEAKSVYRVALSG